MTVERQSEEGTGSQHGLSGKSSLPTGPIPSERIHGSGPTASRVREFDWASTPLGPIVSWSETLLATVNLMLSNRFGCNIFWGPELIQVYNDAYAIFLGEKESKALGQRADVCWSEAWEFLAPQVEAVMKHGKTTYLENVLIPIERGGCLQDLSWTYSYSPVYLPDGAIGGLFITCQETTLEVLATRKLRESEDRANRILRSIGDAVIVTDKHACITGMNPVAEALTGWTELDAKGHELHDVFSIIDPITRKAVESPAEEVTRLGVVGGSKGPTVLIAQDGRETFIDDSSAPILNDEKQITGVVLVFRDITERRATEQERDLAQQQLEGVMDATTDGILSLDRDWTITYLNKRGGEILAPSGNILGKNFWDSFPSVLYEDSPYVFHYNNAMDHGIAGEFEALYPEPYNLIFAVSVRPAYGGVVLFFRDVTMERREAEALRESEARLSAIYGTSVGFIGLLQPDGTILDCNRAALQLGGTTREKLNGLRYWQGPWFSYTKGMPDVVQRAVVRAATGEFVRHELALVRPSGKIQTFDFSISPVRDVDGTVVFLVPEAHDITTLKSTRAELAASREELHWTVELSTSIPWTADTEGNMLDFSHNWLELSGLTRESALGKGWMQVVHPDDRDSVVATWKQCLQNGEAYHVEHRMRAASGSYRWISVRALPRRDVFGSIVKWYGTVEDIEERKAAEDASIRSQTEAGISQLADSIASRINGPLLHVADLLAQAESSTLPDHIHDLVSTSNRNLRQVVDATGELLSRHQPFLPANPAELAQPWASPA